MNKVDDFIKDFDDNLRKHKDRFTAEEWDAIMVHIVGAGFTVLWYIAGEKTLREFLEDCIIDCKRMSNLDTLNSIN